MSLEAPKPVMSRKPPEKWHDLIRNNVPKTSHLFSIKNEADDVFISEIRGYAGRKAKIISIKKGIFESLSPGLYLYVEMQNVGKNYNLFIEDCIFWVENILNQEKAPKIIMYQKSPQTQSVKERCSDISHPILYIPIYIPGSHARVYEMMPASLGQLVPSQDKFFSKN